MTFFSFFFLCCQRDGFELLGREGLGLEVGETEVVRGIVGESSWPFFSFKGVGWFGILVFVSVLNGESWRYGLFDWS